MRYRLYALIICAALLLSLAGCAGSESSAAAESSSAAPAVSSAAESPSVSECSSEAASESDSSSSPEPEQTTSEAESVLPDKPSAVKELSCLDVPGNALGAVSSRDNKLAILCWGRKNNVVYIADPAADKLISSRKLSTHEEKLLGLRPDGTVITLDFQGQKIYLYPRKGKPLVLDYPRNVLNLSYDPVNDRLTGFSNNIVSVDMKSGKVRELIPVDEKVSEIPAVCFSQGIYASNTRSVERNGSLKVVLRDLSDGTVLSEVPCYDGWLMSFTESCILCESYEGEELTHLVSIFSAADGSPENTLVIPDDISSLNISEYSDYILAPASYDTDDGLKSFLKVIDTSSPAIDLIHFRDSNLYGFKLVCTPAGRWFAAATGGSDKDMHTRLLMLEPSLAEKGRGIKTVPLPGSDGDMPHEVSETYRSARDRADALEEKFGIRVLINEEINDIPENKVHGFTELRDSPEDIIGYLDLLEQRLSAYPEGFFKRFQLPEGGGLRFVLCSNIRPKDMINGHFNTVGFTWETGAWINIVYSAPKLHWNPPTIDHEIWHAAEYLVKRRFTLDEAAWKALDPKGFKYSESYRDYVNGAADNSYTLAGEEEAYFVSGYGKVNSDEDRATLIEETARTSYEEVIGHPRLAAKLRFLEDWIEPYFGYVYFKELKRG